jgi:hypothetical protein
VSARSVCCNGGVYLSAPSTPLQPSQTQSALFPSHLAGLSSLPLFADPVPTAPSTKNISALSYPHRGCPPQAIAFSPISVSLVRSCLRMSRKFECLLGAKLTCHACTCDVSPISDSLTFRKAEPTLAVPRYFHPSPDLKECGVPRKRWRRISTMSLRSETRKVCCRAVRRPSVYANGVQRMQKVTPVWQKCRTVASTPSAEKYV